ncbi:50S ribosomal protein l2 chloroplastic, partial [Phtheirospermum japonicum]
QFGPHPTLGYGSTQFFFYSPKHSPLVQLFLSSFWISNALSQNVVLMWPIPLFCNQFRYSTCCFN